MNGRQRSIRRSRRRRRSIILRRLIRRSIIRRTGIISRGRASNIIRIVSIRISTSRAEASRVLR